MTIQQVFLSIFPHYSYMVCSLLIIFPSFFDSQLNIVYLIAI